MDSIQRDKFKRYRKYTIIFCFPILLLLAFIYFLKIKNYTINITPSLPIGIYKTKKIDRDIKYGDLVLIQITEDIDGYVSRYQNTKVIHFLIKEVVGMENDIFTIEEVREKNISYDVLKKNNIIINNVYRYDSKLKKLPRKSNYYKLNNNEYFVLGKKSNSFDSRYFGTIKRENILKFVEPTFTIDFKEKRK